MMTKVQSMDFSLSFSATVVVVGTAPPAVRPNLKALRGSLESSYSNLPGHNKEISEDVSEKYTACCPSCGCKMQFQGTLLRNERGPP